MGRYKYGRISMFAFASLFLLPKAVVVPRVAEPRGGSCAEGRNEDAVGFNGEESGFGNRLKAVTSGLCGCWYWY